MTTCRVQWRSEARSSKETIMLSCLEVRPVITKKVASKQVGDPVLDVRIRKSRDGIESDDSKDFSLDQNG